MIDSHAHLNDPRYDSILDDVIARAQAAGVEGIINIGYDLPSSRRAVELAQEYGWMYAVVGIHPHDADGPPEIMVELEALAKEKGVVAIGKQA